MSQMSAVSQALLSLTKAEQVRRDTELVMQPHANWEQFLIPAPISIAILGQLVAITSADDFALSPEGSGRSYRFLRYPESFRACLMQLSNQGWRAFSTAHTNMEQIRLHSRSIPAHLRGVLGSLLGPDSPASRRLLPLQLSSIRAAAEQCLGLALAVQAAFSGLIDLTHELLEASVSAGSRYRQEVEAARGALAEAGRRREQMQEEQRQLEERLGRLGQEVEEAQDGYRRAVSSAPGHWGALGLHVAEASINTVSGLVSALVSTVTAEPASLAGAVAGATARILASHTELLVGALRLREVMAGGGLSVGQLRDQASGRGLWLDSEELFRKVKEAVSLEEACAPRAAALSLCERGLAACRELEGLSNRGLGSAEQVEAAIEELYAAALKFSARSTIRTDSPVLSQTAPNLSRAAKANGEPAEPSVAQAALAQARFKMENAKAQLDSSRCRYDESFRELRVTNKELDKVLAEMSRCQVKELDFEGSLALLTRGLQALGKVREQWTKMMHFFQMVSSLIDICLNKTLQQFSDHTQVLQELPGYSHQTFLKDLIYVQVFQATNISNLVHVIASTYVEVSTQHLMPQVTRLGTLLTLEPGDAEFQAERHKLHQGCDQARKMIMELVLRHKDEFESKVQQRMDAIEQTLEGVLPPPTPLEAEAIQGSLRADQEATFRELSSLEEEQWA
uniref:Uncharacterized protein n=1 Tax=Callorhinchus milii TaxID=7868 RepID=A0A4W3JK35_CALMI